MGCSQAKEYKTTTNDAFVIDVEFTQFSDRSTLITDSCVTDRYIIHQKIGSGAFSDVFNAQHKATKVPYAIKTIKIHSYDLKKNFISEAEALKRVNHPYIIKLHDVLSSQLNAYIVMELATGGDVFERIRDNRENGCRLSVAESCRVTRMITDALSYLHANGITHRDLKAENVLYYSPGLSRVLLTDFGCSSLRGADTLLDTYCGTREYLSPELITKRLYTNKVDVWALGCLVYFMVSGRLPWNGMDMEEKISKVEHAYKEEIWTTVPEETKNFIDLCLQKNPNQRATSKDLFQHIWINDDTSKLINNRTKSIDYASTTTKQRHQSKDSANYTRPKKISLQNHIGGDDSAFLPPISGSPDEKAGIGKRKKLSSGGETGSIPQRHRYNISPTNSHSNCFNVSDDNISVDLQQTIGKCNGTRRIFVDSCKTITNDEKKSEIPIVLPRNQLDYVIRKEDLLASLSSTSTLKSGDTPIHRGSISSTYPPSSSVPVLSGFELYNGTQESTQSMDISTTVFPPSSSISTLSTFDSNNATQGFSVPLTYPVNSSGQLGFDFQNTGNPNAQAMDIPQSLPHHKNRAQPFNQSPKTSSFQHTQLPPILQNTLFTPQALKKQTLDNDNTLFTPQSFTNETSDDRNALFTPQNLRHYSSNDMLPSEDMNSDEHHRAVLEDLFTATSSRRPSIGLRRLRSTSPNQPTHHKSLPPAFLYQELKVQSWLNAIQEDDTKNSVCPKANDIGHPKFCKICTQGKWLAKSF